MMVRALLKKHEGLSLKPYRDTKGLITIGVGRCLDRIGITEAEANYLLSGDLVRVGGHCMKYLPWFRDLNPARKAVIISMAFNLGLAGVLKFNSMIQAIEDKRWALAAAEMLNSKWAQQVGQRAVELAHMMHSGEFPPGLLSDEQPPYQPSEEV